MVRIGNKIFSHDESVARNVMRFYNQTKTAFNQALSKADSQRDFNLRTWLANYDEKEDVGQGYTIQVTLNRKDADFQGSHDVTVNVVMKASVMESGRPNPLGNVKFYQLRGTYLPALEYKA